MKGNSSHNQGDGDGSQVPDRESELRSSLEDMVKRLELLGEKLASFHNSSSSFFGDASIWEAMMRRVVQEVLEEKLASFHNSSSSVFGDASIWEAMMRRVGVLEEKLESFHNSSSRSSFDQFDPSQRRGSQLHFDGKLPAALYTCCRMESEDSQPVKNNSQLWVIRTHALVRVREEVEKIFASFHHSISRSSFDPSQRRGFQLHFDGKLPVTLYTCSRIESEDRKPVKIFIFDASNKIISSGPLSSMKVEIVPLDGDFGASDQGDWTEQEFNAKIVHAREGKRQLVTGESVIRLRNGVGYIDSVSFTDNSRWIRSQKFRLGARAVPGIFNEVRVREARSEPFSVEDKRGPTYKKHHPPHLDDEIWRLERIARGGVSHYRLSKNGITNIRHFLKSYYEDPSSLRGLLGPMSDEAWKIITEHATAARVPGQKTTWGRKRKR